MLGDIQDGFFGTCCYALWVAAAHVAFEWCVDIFMHEYGTYMTCTHTGMAGDTSILQYGYHAICDYYGIGGTCIPAFWLLALFAYYGHLDNRMRIK